jgi:alpha-N-arabinofuranosidase
MFFNPKDEGSEAGVSMFQKDNNYINFTLINQNDNILIQINAIKDGVLEDSFVSEINNYKGQIEFKVTASKSKYELSYSLNGKEFIFVKSLDYSIIKSNGYTGAHLGVYASGNGQISNDYASFDYVNYLIKTK